MVQNNSTINKIHSDRRFLGLLAHDFPTISSVTTEIINLEAILNLPKPTEHFLADLHGENEAFEHVLRNASGNIKRKVNDLFGNTLRAQEMKDLCTLIYYPEEKIEIVRAQEENIEDYYRTTLNRLVAVCRNVSSKYTRSKVRKSLPEEFAYIIEELLHETSDGHNKQNYFNVIIETIIDTGRAEHFIIALCYLIQRLAIDQLHILGDIFDRGPGAHMILDRLCEYHRLDIQWGNHDMLWMGAAAGNLTSIASVLRISLRYANTRSLEDGYGINMVRLATFAMETYGEDPCEEFHPKFDDDTQRPSERQKRLLAQMHKAIAVIQFKLEGQLYERNPYWDMDDRSLLKRINFEKGTVTLYGKEYPMKDMNFPTINPENPYELNDDEKDVMKQLRHSFMINDRLQKHINCLLTRGSMYGVFNSNLLFHASLPLNEDGTMRRVDVCGQEVEGMELMERVDQVVRIAFDKTGEKDEHQMAVDYLWYLWCGKNSPLFDKEKMTTFERYFIADKDTHKEPKGWYYRLREAEEVCDYILDAFNVKGEHRHIINGHVPVHVSQGETPIKAGGKLMVIDGGFSKAYHSTTGIAGYTLVYHSRGFQLVQHEPFESMKLAIEQGTDIRSSIQIVEMMGRREMVADTDKGKELQDQIEDLKKLLLAYRKGVLKERK